MKTRVLTSVLGLALVVSVASHFVDRAFGQGTVIPPPTKSSLAAIIGFPAPDYDSGWVPMALGLTLTLNHGVGGNPDNFFVDFQQRGEFGGITNYLRGSEPNNSVGAYYFGLGPNNVTLQRTWQDDLIPGHVQSRELRIRIWVTR